MRKLLMLLVLVATLFGVSSCQLHSPVAANLYQNNTNVVLQDNNYKIIQKVRGEAYADYFLYFGGFRKNGLIEEARSEMLENANLVGSSELLLMRLLKQV